MGEETPPNGRIDRSGEIIGRYRSKLKAGSAERKTLADELETTKVKLANATRAADEAPLKLENDRLKGEIRSDRHKAVFARLAAAAGAKAKAIDHLYATSGWKAEKDVVDEAAMGATIDGLKASADYAFGAGDSVPSPTTPTATPPKPAAPAVPGAGRGGRVGPAAMGITITKAMRADNKFMLDPANKAAIAEAAKAGRFE